MITGAVKIEYLRVPDRSKRGTMPFNPYQGLGYAESKLVRAAKALPLLSPRLPFISCGECKSRFTIGFFLSRKVRLIILRALPPMIERMIDIMQHGVDNNIGRPGHLQPLQKFYGIEFIDSRFRSLVACFASIQFVDVICHWQTFSFLTDAGIIYAIFLFESARQSNALTFASM